MSFAKSNVVLLIVAAVLAVPTAFQLSSEVESFVDYARIPLMFDGFTEENVGAIVIGKPKEEQPAPNPQTPEKKPPVAYDQLNLRRTDKGWMVGQTPGVLSDLVGAKVNEGLIKVNVFDHLRMIRADKETMIQRAATEEQLAEYGLDDAQAMVIKVADRGGVNVVAQIHVGNDASQMASTEGVRGVFVRKADSNDVVLYEFDKGWNRNVDPEQWVDRVLLRLAPEDVRAITIANAASGGKPITFERKDNKASWVASETAEGRGAVRQSEVEGFVQRLRMIAVQSFKLPIQRAGNLAALGLQPPQCSLEITYVDGGAERKATFQVGNPVEGDSNTRYFTSSEAAFLMTWPAAQATTIEVDVAAKWFDPDGPPTDADKAAEDQQQPPKTGQPKKDG